MAHLLSAKNELLSTEILSMKWKTKDPLTQKKCIKTEKVMTR